MTERNKNADAEFRRVMTNSAKRLLSGDQRPYEVGIRLMGELVPMLSEAEFAGAAYHMWGFLTDGIDGPPRYARGLSEQEIENLMRLAAREWLSLASSPEELRRYFDRWEKWPDSLATS
jgi:hypothetical protein